MFLFGLKMVGLITQPVGYLATCKGLTGWLFKAISSGFFTTLLLEKTGNQIIRKVPSYTSCPVQHILIAF